MVVTAARRGLVVRAVTAALRPWIRRLVVRAGTAVMVVPAGLVVPASMAAMRVAVVTAAIAVTAAKVESAVATTPQTTVSAWAVTVAAPVGRGTAGRAVQPLPAGSMVTAVRAVAVGLAGGAVWVALTLGPAARQVVRVVRVVMRVAAVMRVPVPESMRSPVMAAWAARADVAV
jgi:hypothetical protein